MGDLSFPVGVEAQARDGRRYVELSSLKRRGLATWTDERELGELERRMALRYARQDRR